MKAMVLEKIRQPLVLKEVPKPIPQPFEILIKVQTCGVCRTDLHIVDGELPHPKLPLIPGHQIIGKVEQVGEKVTKYKIGSRVGVPWLGQCCHHCEFCLSNRENLCDHAIFTGYLRDGGYAEFCTAHEEFTITIPDRYDAIHAAPLTCAGLIGFRAFRLAQPCKTIGLYGFGSAAHLLIQAIVKLGYDVFVFTRPGDKKTQDFAKSLGALWVGGSDEIPPVSLDSAILFAPVGALYPQALKAIKKGGKVVSAGIHMSDIPSFPYSLLWEERTMTSVANLTRQDAIDYMDLVGKLDLKVNVNVFPLEEANQALDAIRKGKIEGSAVLQIE